MSTRVVYTAIAGHHAKLSVRPTVSDTDFICYSDVPLDRADWEVRPIEASTGLSPRMRAKYHKLFPPTGYAWSVWLDGAYVLREDAVTMVDDLVARSASGIGLHRHHDRACVFDEAEHSRSLVKCAEVRATIAAQADHYGREGHPHSWGLWAGGLLCRDASPRVANVMRRWWRELIRWTWRDQLSLPIALRAADFQPDAWEWPLFQNPHVAAWAWNETDHGVVQEPG